MRVLQFLGLVALPLAAAMPAATHHSAHEVGAPLSERSTLIAASQFNFAPFSLTNMTMECTRPCAPEAYACTLRFDWYDPNSVKQNMVNDCTCLYKWSWDGKTAADGAHITEPDSFTMCRMDNPNYFEMRMASFNSSTDFSLEIAHRYQDSENFTAPYDFPLTFSQPDIHLPVVTHEENLLKLHDDGPILANITAVSD